MAGIYTFKPSNTKNPLQSPGLQGVFHLHPKGLAPQMHIRVRRESNARPFAPEANALSPELRTHLQIILTTITAPVKSRMLSQVFNLTTMQLNRPCYILYKKSYVIAYPG